MPPRYWGLYLTDVWMVLLMPDLGRQIFTIGHMMCLHSSSVSVISGKGYFMFWGIVELNSFYASFCLTHPYLIEVDQAVAFL